MEELIKFLWDRHFEWQVSHLIGGSTTLDLGNSNIGDQEVRELARILKASNPLTTLYLRRNNISDQGAKELAETLKDDNSLMNLYLGSNNISNQGAMALAKALKVNNSCTRLDLQGNNIDKSTLDTINVYLQRNQTIAEKKAESLNAEGNNLCNQEKYSKAIEKYKAAIKITNESLHKENELYRENKANAKKKYEKQQTGPSHDTIINKIEEIIDNQNITDEISVSGGDSDFVPPAG